MRPEELPESRLQVILLVVLTEVLKEQASLGTYLGNRSLEHTNMVPHFREFRPAPFQAISRRNVGELNSKRQIDLEFSAEALQNIRTCSSIPVELFELCRISTDEEVMSEV